MYICNLAFIVQALLSLKLDCVASDVQNINKHCPCFCIQQMSILDVPYVTLRGAIHFVLEQLMATDRGSHSDSIRCGGILVAE